jgi:membrane fusion protein (multidrug efflux system)
MPNFLSRPLSVLVWLITAAVGFCCGCGRSNPPAAAGSNTPPAVNVQIVRPHKGEITRTITLPTFKLLAYQEATLYAKVAGYLKTINADKGDQVKEGQLLAEIEVPELLADRAKYKAEVEVAAIDFKRISEARTKAPDLVVPQMVDSAKAKYEVAKANLEGLETLLAYAKITAPFSGVVTRRWVDPGAFIPAATSSSASQNSAILTVMDFRKVRIQVAVPEPEVPFIKNGVPAQVSVEELPGRVFDGTVTRYAHALEETTKTMLTEIELPNPEGEFLPGMYARVRIVLERKADALLVPAETLVLEKTGASLFTVVDNKAKKVPVKTGFNDGVAVEVLDGLKPDEPVILLGKQSVGDGQAVAVVEPR